MDRFIQLKSFLLASPGLFAILDGARSSDVLNEVYEYANSRLQMGASSPRFQSLYNGHMGNQIGQFGPVLVELDEHAQLVEKLLLHGWGRSWGIYIKSDVGFSELRSHFRRFLFAVLPDGQQVFFRFYDPRILAEYATLVGPESLLWRDAGTIIIEANCGGKVLVVDSSNLKAYELS